MVVNVQMPDVQGYLNHALSTTVHVFTHNDFNARLTTYGISKNVFHFRLLVQCSHEMNILKNK